MFEEAEKIAEKGNVSFARITLQNIIHMLCACFANDLRPGRRAEDSPVVQHCTPYGRREQAYDLPSEAQGKEGRPALPRSRALPQKSSPRGVNITYIESMRRYIFACIQVVLFATLIGHGHLQALAPGEQR